MGGSVFLVGFMGAGKSSVGSLLADRLRLPFLDLDRLIEEDAGLSIAEIFQRHGESSFRAMESRLLQRALAQGPAVVALGGGAYSNAANRDLARSGGVVVWLDVPLKTAWARCASDPTRPLAADRTHFEELYLRRRDDYRLADHRVVATANPRRLAAEIARLLAGTRTDHRSGPS